MRRKYKREGNYNQVPPAQTVTQRLANLEKANEVRSRMAQTKRDITSGQLNLRDLLLEYPEETGRIPIVDVMKRVPGLGKGNTTRILAKCRIHPDRTIAGLNLRQRAQLISALKKYYT